MAYGNEESKDKYTEEEQVRNKLSEIKKARTLRDDMEKKYRWRELIKEYKGEFDLADGRYDMTILPVNLIFAYVKTELPSLYIRDPHIKINPKNRTSINTSKVLEIVINYIWRYKKLKREIKKCIIDALLIGHSWLKVGYTGKFGTAEDSSGKTVDTIEEEDIFAYHVDWESITFSCDSMDPPYDSKWISHAVWLSPDEVKNNPNYTNTENLPTAYEDKDLGDDISEIEKRHKGKIKLEEVWDIEKQQKYTICEGVDKFIEPPKPWPLAMRGMPFSMLKFNFTNEMSYGIPDVAMFEPQVLELIKVRSASLDHIKRYNRQLLTTPNNISDDEAAKLAKGITGSVINCEDPTKIMPLPYPPLQTDIYAIEERIKEDMINISGQSPQERGATQKTSTRTVAELNLMREGAVNRRSEKIDLVEDFVEEVAIKLVGLLQQFVDMPYYVRILGSKSPELQGAVQERASAGMESAVTNQGGFTFTAEDIEGEFDLETVSGSSTPLDIVEENKTLLQMVELAPKAGAIPGGPLMGAIAKKLIENTNMFELILALEAEQQAQQQNSAAQAAQAEEMKNLQIAQAASESQLDAENAATKANKVQMEFLKMMKESQAREEEVEKEAELEAAKVTSEINNEKRRAEVEMELEATKLTHQLKLEELKLQHELELERLKAEAEIRIMKQKQNAQPKEKSE